MRTILTIVLFLLGSATLWAADSHRFVEQVRLPSGQTVVVAEGDFEARSIGSFSVRLYAAAKTADATTFFTAGVIQRRDGVIEKVMLADIDDDQKPEVLVIVRSAGSGGYLSVHAFTVDHDNLFETACLEGLPPDADPVTELRKSVVQRK